MIYIHATCGHFWERGDYIFVFFFFNYYYYPQVSIIISSIIKYDIYDINVYLILFPIIYWLYWNE